MEARGSGALFELRKETGEGGYFGLVLVYFVLYLRVCLRQGKGQGRARATVLRTGTKVVEYSDTRQYGIHEQRECCLECPLRVGLPSAVETHAVEWYGGIRDSSDR